MSADTDTGADETITELRETLKAATDARPSDCDAHLKAALGEAVDLRARDLPNTADLREAVENAIVAPEEEKPFFLNQALRELERVEERAGEWGLLDDTALAAPARTGEAATRGDDGAVDVDKAGPAPEGVRWTDAAHGVVELELTRPLIEWLELEAAEADADSIPAWIRRQLWIRLTGALAGTHAPTVDVDIELPDDYAHRASLWFAHQRIQGQADEADLRVFLSNHMNIRETWLLDGEPWMLAEEAGLHDHDHDDADGGADE